MSLKLRLDQDATQAMRARDVARLSTLRLLKAAIKNAEVAKMSEITDEEVIALLSREVKQRRETIPDFSRGGRQDLVEKAESEIAVISHYLPEPLSEAELDALVLTALTEVSAQGLKDQGKVMGYLAPRVKGRADGKEVSQKVKAHLEKL